MSGSGPVRVRVPATVANLGPGFDALGLALDLSNQVEMEVTGEALPGGAGDTVGGIAEVAVDGEGEQELPRDGSNRVAQAAALLWKRVRGQVPRLRIRCVNRVPLRSGLGSSAAAAVGGLVAANRLLGDPLSGEEILSLAWEMEGHGDNAAPALAGGITVLLPGERSFLRLEPPALDVALALPDRRWSTEASRGLLPQQVAREDAVFNLTASAALVAALALRRYDVLAVAMQDRLHQPQRLPYVPGARQALAGAMDAGALGAALAGAGPAVVALVPPGRGEGVAAAMARAFEAAGQPARPLVCQPAGEGALDSGLRR